MRLLVGTRKGAFVLTSDEGRRDWKVDGPLFAGWEIYHLAGSPIDPDRIWASQSGGWFGQVVQRSTDGGRTWDPVGNDFSYASEVGTHQHYDGTLKLWVFNRVWHLEPSLTDLDTVYAVSRRWMPVRSAPIGGSAGRHSSGVRATPPTRWASAATLTDPGWLVARGAAEAGVRIDTAGHRTTNLHKDGELVGYDDVLDRLEAAVEVGGPPQPEPLEAEGGQARGVALVAHHHDLAVRVVRLGQPVGRRGVEAPLEDVAVDDQRPLQLAVPRPLLDRADVDDQSAAGPQRRELRRAGASGQRRPSLSEDLVDPGLTHHRTSPKAAMPPNLRRPHRHTRDAKDTLR